jgi:hypothetical protein
VLEDILILWAARYLSTEDFKPEKRRKAAT